MEIAEAGGKRILLTGDARGDKIIQGLELVGALEPNGTMHVDVLKMPHHGSDRNMETSFLRRITAEVEQPGTPGHAERHDGQGGQQQARRTTGCAAC